MEFRSLPVFAIALVLAVAVSHAALPAEMYWKSVLPNSPIPKAVRNLLLPTAGNYKAVLSEMVKDNKGKVPPQAKVYESRNPSNKFEGNKNMLADLAKNKVQVQDLFFFESELHPGKKMKVPDLILKRSKATFLPRPVADSIPFSTQKFPEILKYFSMEAKSAEANLLKQTIEICERPAIEGEVKYCATSLESLVDIGVSKLGKNIQLLSDELEKDTENPEFTIGQGVKMMGESEIACHKMNYAYAVFLCHSIESTVIYTVPLVGADGTRARALAVCHKDTSAWNPNELAFQILNVKPGTIPICHFFTSESLVWVPNTLA